MQRSIARTAFLLALAAPALAQTPAQAPKAQLPADQRAYTAARTTHDPAARLTALQQFVKDYPKSTRVGRAQSAIFSILVDNFPDRTKDIEEQSKTILHDEKSLSKWRTEMIHSFTLANAGPNGADLPYADKLAKDSYDHLTEQVYDKETSQYYSSKPNLNAADRADQHTRFAHERAETVTSLGFVRLHEGKLPEARALAAEAYSLDPLVDDVSALLGEIALQDGNSAEALKDFERAELLGSLKLEDRTKTVELYKQAHGGSDAGMNAEMDRTYAQLFPEPFNPSPHQAVTGGHTALFELFTGSGCPPCVGGDLAVDAMLEAYPRTELIALAYDLHIPEPDPLTTPETVARANVYGVNSTPSYALDGVKLGAFGAVRTGSEELYKKLVKSVDPAIARPTAVKLSLTATPSADGTIAVSASVTAPDLDAVKAELKPPPPPPADPKAKPAAVPNETGPISDPLLVVNFALVEDDIRYSGENGIRFHRMVVRSLAKAAGNGFMVQPGATTTADATFDPAAISRKLLTYLDGYEQDNDRFGPIKFLSKDTSMQPGHLSIAAWVQDSVTHRILQSAYVPLGPATHIEGTR